MMPHFFFANSQDTLSPGRFAVCCGARLYNAPLVLFQNVWFCSASRIFLFWLCATLAFIKPNLLAEPWNRRGSSHLQVLQNITDGVANVAIFHYNWWAPWRSAALTLAAASLVQWSKRGNMSAFGLLPMKYCPLEEDMTVSCGRKFALSLCSLTSRTKTLRILMRSGVCLCVCVSLSLSVCVAGELKEKLEDFVSQTNSKHPGFIKMVRHSKQEGLIRSRVSGWRAATAPVVALFDAHVEFNTGWWVTRKECCMMRAQLITRVLVTNSHLCVCARVSCGF